MKKFIVCALCMPLALSCRKGHFVDDEREPEREKEQETLETTIEGLTNFEVKFNKSSLTGETDNTPPLSFDDSVYITFKNGGAEVSGNITDLVIAKYQNEVTIAIPEEIKSSYLFSLSGEADGYFSLTNEEKADIAISLEGLKLTASQTPAICVASKGKKYLLIKEGTENTLKRTGAKGDEKGVFCSKKAGETFVCGKGTLEILSEVTEDSVKHGISSKGNLYLHPCTNLYISTKQGNCIKCDGNIIMEGGVLNLDNSALAGKGLSADGDIIIKGGRLTAICTGNGTWDEDDQDVSGAAGIKADGIFSMEGGDVWLKSTGSGGKGINGDSTLKFNGGSVHISTTGGVYALKQGTTTYDTKPKGIKTDQDIWVEGGEIYVQTTGVKEGSEGIEAKESFTLNGGKVQIYALDDALNVGYSQESAREKQGVQANAGKIYIKNGYIYAYSVNNDGIDANGTMEISGGTAIAFGATTPEDGFDCDQNSFVITGGLVLGFGGSSSTPSTNKAYQSSVLLGRKTLIKNYTYVLRDVSQDTIIASISMPRGYNTATILLSSPSFVGGRNYSWGYSTANISSFDTFTCSTASNLTSIGASGGGGEFPGGGGKEPFTPGGGGNKPW